MIYIFVRILKSLLVGTILFIPFSIVAETRTVGAGTIQLLDITYFDDGNARKGLSDLRLRLDEVELMTDEENAILETGNRIGWLRFPNCENKSGTPLMGNAFLVQIDGRDAVLTSAHEVFDLAGQVQNGCDISDLQTAIYFQNASYLTASKTQADDPVFDRTKVSANQASLRNVLNRRVSIDLDFIIFYFDSAYKISKQRSLDGGSIGFSKYVGLNAVPNSGFLYLLGFDPLYEKGLAVTYQKCSFFIEAEIVYHTCDTSKGSSSSFLGVLLDGEIRFLGMHSEGSSFFRQDGERLTPSNYRYWNKGISAFHILGVVDTYVATETQP